MSGIISSTLDIQKVRSELTARTWLLAGQFAAFFTSSLIGLFLAGNVALAAILIKF